MLVGRLQPKLKFAGVENWLKVDFSGHWSIIGRTVVVHAEEDDLGLGNFPDSKTNGNSGTSIGCGVIGIASEEFIASGTYHKFCILWQ